MSAGKAESPKSSVVQECLSICGQLPTKRLCEDAGASLVCFLSFLGLSFHLYFKFSKFMR